MGYASYEFYTNKYYGNSILETDFGKWNDKASRQIDILTSRRLLSSYPTDKYTDEQIKLCVCDIAEKMMEIDKYIKASALDSTGKSGIVKSESAGSESVSYATTDTQYSNIANNQETANTFYMSVASSYLSGLTDSNGICLLYKGV